MSKWTDFRDDIVESLQVEEVTEQVKQNLTKQIVESILPAVKTAADGFTAKIKEQAKAETGWCKIRDMLVLPLVIRKRRKTPVYRHGDIRRVHLICVSN